jgi:hypothetical protein
MRREISAEEDHGGMAVKMILLITICTSPFIILILILIILISSCFSFAYSSLIISNNSSFLMGIKVDIHRNEMTRGSKMRKARPKFSGAEKHLVSG